MDVHMRGKVCVCKSMGETSGLGRFAFLGFGRHDGWGFLRSTLAWQVLQVSTDKTSRRKYMQMHGRAWMWCYAASGYKLYVCFCVW